jgi:hypothetical protein
VAQYQIAACIATRLMNILVKNQMIFASDLSSFFIVVPFCVFVVYSRLFVVFGLVIELLFVDCAL